MKTIALGLVRGRHDMPVDGYVLDSITNVSDMTGISLAVTKSLTEKLGDYIHIDHFGDYIHIDHFGGCVNQANDDDVSHYRCDAIESHVELHLYITGLTLTSVALAVVSFCAENGVPLVAYHYDRDTNTYIQQRVLW